jgi:hypothetical protein
MTTTPASLTQITDADLLTAVANAAGHERSATVHLIALLAELDARRLYPQEGCSSLFTYCTRALRLSEHAAYDRIEAARCARRFPIVLELLTDGAVTLTTIGLLAPHLTPDNVHEVLTAARHASKREVERLVAALRPLPPVPSSVRKLPAPAVTTSARSGQADGDVRGAADPMVAEGGARTWLGDGPRVSPPPPRPASVTPLAPERYKLQVTISRETHDTLRRAQDLLRHVIPNGDPAAIVSRALTLLVADLEKTRLAATARPRPTRSAATGSRHVPAAVKRQVWARDQGRCAFVGTTGRCTERGFLELHHVVPFAAGGPTTVQNLEIRCRRHNAYEAEQWFGPLLARETRAVYGATRSRPRNESDSGVRRLPSARPRSRVMGLRGNPPVA